MASIFTAEGVVAGYGAGVIVDGVNVEADKGQIAVLLGPNGAGKSTLMKAILGLVPRSAGKITLLGEDVSKLPTEQLIKRGLAYVPQVQKVFATLTVVENLEIGGYSMPVRKAADRVEQLLDLFPVLRKAARRTAGTLSGGERSLLALARGLMPMPTVLLADEPTAGLSPQHERVVWDHMDLIRNTGVAVLVVEQNVRTALERADHAYVLVLGTTRLQGRASEVAASSQLASLYIGGQLPASARSA